MRHKIRTSTYQGRAFSMRWQGNASLPLRKSVGTVHARLKRRILSLQEGADDVQRA